MPSCLSNLLLRLSIVGQPQERLVQFPVKPKPHRLLQMFAKEDGFVLGVDPFVERFKESCVPPFLEHELHLLRPHSILRPPREGRAEDIAGPCLSSVEENPTKFCRPLCRSAPPVKGGRQRSILDSDQTAGDLLTHFKKVLRLLVPATHRLRELGIPHERYRTCQALPFM